MEDFNITNTSQGLGYDHSNNQHFKTIEFVVHVMTCIIISVGLPLILIAIYALYSLVRNDHVAPIYVINLLISDLIQLGYLIAKVARPMARPSFAGFLYSLSLMASVCFMVCVALERYLVVACPLWYRFRRSIKISVAVCILFWVVPVVCVLLSHFSGDLMVQKIIYGIFYLLPLPLFIFSLVGTLRALSASRFPPDEKRRIVGILVLVLLTYMLLFLPGNIWYLAKRNMSERNVYEVFSTFTRLNPLADLFLYVFMRKGIIDKLLASVCCCRMDSNNSSRVDSSDICSSSV